MIVNFTSSLMAVLKGIGRLISPWSDADVWDDTESWID